MDNRRLTEDQVKEAVSTYFEQYRFTVESECPIQFGSGKGRMSGSADVVVKNAEGYWIVIVECKSERVGIGLDGEWQLKSYLSATDTRFGILAASRDPADWVYFENLRSNVFIIRERLYFNAHLNDDPPSDRPDKDAINQLKIEKEELETDNDLLSNDKTQLQTDNEKLETDINQLKIEKEELETDNDLLSNDKTQLQTDNEKLETDINQLKIEKEELETDNDLLSNDKTQLQTDNEKLETDINQLKIEKEELETDNDLLSNDKTQLQTDNEKLETDINQLKIEKEELETDNDLLRNDKTQLQTDNEKLETDNEKLKRTLKNVAIGLIVPLLIAVGISVYFLIFQPPQNNTTYQVIRIIDGDTVEIKYKGKLTSVQLIGVNAPEPNTTNNRPSEPYGEEANKYLQELLLDKAIYLRFDDPTWDQYDRIRGYVYRAADSIFVNLEMIREGYAEVDLRYSFKYEELFMEYESRAKADRKGMWGGY